MGLAILPRINHQDTLESLSEYHKALYKRRESMQVRLESQRPLPYFVEAMFDYSLTLVNAEIDWVEKFIQKLKSMEGDTRDHKEANDD